MGSSKIPLRIPDWIGGIQLRIGGSWPPGFTWGAKEKMFSDSVFASVVSMFIFLFYDSMNKEI